MSVIYNGEARTTFTAKNKTHGEFNKITRGLTSMQRAAATLGVTFGALSASLAVRELISVNAEYQKLNASLITVTGSQKAANEVFSNLKEFSTKTPYQLSEITEAYIKMKALGLDPTQDALTSFGNTASAMGKDLNQMVEAVADAVTGEFERLKEFGIKSKSEGDNVTFTFQNVSTTIQKEATAIQGYLQKIGNAQFSVAMTLQMDTIGGAMSNLEGNWSNLVASFGEAGGINVASGAINALSSSLERLGDSVLTFKQMQSSGSMTFWEWLTTDSKELAGRNVEEKAMARARKEIQNLESELAMGGSNPNRVSVIRREIDYWTEGIAEFETLINRRTKLESVFHGTGAAVVSPGKTTPTGDFGGVGYVGDAWISRDMGMDAANARASRQAQSLAENSGSINTSWIDDSGLSLMQQQQDERFSLLQGFKQAEYDLQVDHLSGMSALTTTYINDDIKLTLLSAHQKEQIWSASMSTFSDFTNALFILGGRHSKKMFKINKIAGIAEATVDTYSAANKTWAKWGYPYGIPMVAAVVAAGMANVAAISSQSFSSGKSAAGGTGRGTSGSPIITAPAAQTVATESREINIIIHGNVVDQDKFARELIPSITKAINDGVS